MIMDCRVGLLFQLVVLVLLLSTTEGRTKKVVIHVPLKVQKVKHTHTIYKTIHHHHTHHEPHIVPHVDHEEHEHFHYMHLIDEPPTPLYNQPLPPVQIRIPEFLPDIPLNLPNVPNDISTVPSLHIPLYKKH